MTQPPAITLPLSIYTAIIAHAQEGAPEEVCGILGGRDGVATELARGRNEAANPRMDYWVDGQTLLKQFDFADRREEMIAIYHSHPADAAYPSAVDARYAFYPDAVYLICSLAQPEQPVIRAFRLHAQNLSQRPATAQPVRGDPCFLAQLHRCNDDRRPDRPPIESVLSDSDRSGRSPTELAASSSAVKPVVQPANYYDLIVIGVDGREHWQRVRIMELAINIVP